MQGTSGMHEPGMCELKLTCRRKAVTKWDDGTPSCEECVSDFREFLKRDELARLESRIQELHNRGLDLPEGFPNIASDPAIEDGNSESWAKARDWEADKNVYIYGPVGTGKTWMSHILLQNAFIGTQFRHGCSVGVVSARQFCKVTDRYDDKGRLKAWSQCKVLLLDDLDKGNWNTERLGALWDLLDYRNTHSSFTIITANVSPVALREVLREAAPNNRSMADSCFDRLKPCLTIELKGKSLRK